MHASSQPQIATIRFGVYEVDLRARELRKQGIKVRLQEQPLQVLQTLLEHPGEIVTREDLRKRIWPSDTFVDFDGGVNNAMKRLREALGDSADNPRFIETIPKRGYRFILPVNGYGNEGLEASGHSLSSSESAPADRHSRQRPLVVAVSSSILFFVIAWLALGRLGQKWSRSADVPQIRSIAVLPLENLSRDSEQDYFADGMTEELITQLSQIRALKVISRTSVAQYKATTKPLGQIARELNVDAVVEGSVRRDGDRVRVTAQLIYAPTDSNVLARNYDSDLKDVLSLQSTVASAIADEIRVKMSPGEETRLHAPPAMSFKAHEAYLQGNYFAGIGQIARAIEFFQQALQEGANAYVYVGLARVYSSQAGIEADPRDVMPKAKAAALKALELDDSMAEAHLALADVYSRYDWEWPNAELQFKRAIELNPSLADAHDGYGFFLESLGRFEEGKTEHLRAQEVDPLGEHMAEVFYHHGDLDGAMEVLEHQAQRTPEDVGVHWQLGITFALKGMHEKAIREWEQMFAFSNYGSQYRLDKVLQKGFQTGGFRGALRAVLQRLERIPRQEAHVPPRIMVEFYMFSGDNERALAWLEKAYQERDDIMTGIRTDPDYIASLRVEPRFQDLIRRVGLPQ